MADDSLVDLFGSRQSSPTQTVAVEVIQYVTPPPDTAETPANARVIGRRWDTGEIVELALALAEDVKNAHNRPSIRQFVKDNNSNPVTTAIGGTLVLESAQPASDLPPLGPDKSAAVMVGRWIVRIANSKDEGWALRSMALLHLPRPKNPNNPAEGETQRLQIMDNSHAVVVDSLDALQEQVFHALDNGYREKHFPFTRPGFPLAFVRVSTGSSSAVRSLMGGSYSPLGSMHKAPKTNAMIRADLPKDPGFIDMMNKARNLVGEPGYTVEVIPGSQLIVGRRAMEKSSKIYGPTEGEGDNKRALFTELVVGIRRSPKTGMPQVLYTGSADKSLMPNRTGLPQVAGAPAVHQPSAPAAASPAAPAHEAEPQEAASKPVHFERWTYEQGAYLDIAIKDQGVISFKEAMDEQGRLILPLEVVTNDVEAIGLLKAGVGQGIWHGQRTAPGSWALTDAQDVRALLNDLALKGYQVNKVAYSFCHKFPPANDVEQEPRPASKIHVTGDVGAVINISGSAKSTPHSHTDHSSTADGAAPAASNAVDVARHSQAGVAPKDILIVEEVDDSFTIEGQSDNGRQMLDDTHIAWKGARAETPGHWALPRTQLPTLLGCIKVHDDISYAMARREDQAQVAQQTQAPAQKPEPTAAQQASPEPAAQVQTAVTTTAAPVSQQAQHIESDIAPALKEVYYAAKQADAAYQTLLVSHFGKDAGNRRYDLTHSHPELNAAAAEFKARSSVQHWATQAHRCAEQIPRGTLAPGEPMHMRVNPPSPTTQAESLTLVAQTDYQASYLRHQATAWQSTYNEQTGEVTLAPVAAEMALKAMIMEGIAVKPLYVAPAPLTEQPVAQTEPEATPAPDASPAAQQATAEPAERGLSELDLDGLDINFDDALERAYNQYSQHAHNLR